MQINIYKDKLLGANLFGVSVLYSTQPIPREDIPQGWYCYDLRGTVRHPDEPHSLVDKAEENHTGTVLSYLPLKNGRSESRPVKNMFQMTGTNPTLAEFCAAENIRCPEVPLRHQMRPASPEEAGLFYAQTPEKERCVYRLRCNPIEGDYQAYLSCFDKQAQKLETAPVVGRVTFASGESEDFTDPQEYLKAVREELPCHATTGFRCETLTDDPTVRKAVDDMVCDLYGEENPRPIEDYGGTEIMMGGMM